MSDTDFAANLRQESRRSWWRFTFVLLLICVVFVGIVLASRDNNVATAAVSGSGYPTAQQQAENASLKPPLPQTSDQFSAAMRIPYSAAVRTQAVADLEHFAQDPVTYSSQQVINNVLAQAAQNGQQTLTHDQLVKALGLPEGFTVQVLSDTFNLPFLGRGEAATLSFTAEWTGNYAPTKFTATLVNEGGVWKVLYLDKAA